MSELSGNEAKARLAASILLTLPGQPYVYYGEEIGMLGKKPDEAIREPIRWTNNGKDSHTTTWEALRFNIDQTISVESQKENTTSLYHQYKELISFRHSSKDLLSGDIQPVNLNEHLLAYTRGNLLIVHNLSAKNIPLDIPIGYRFIKYFPITKTTFSENVLSGFSTLIFQKQ
jgi:glycosidase